MSLMLFILMICLNIYLDSSSSNKINLNISQNSLITAHKHSFITVNSSVSDFFKFYWTINKHLTILHF